MKINFTFFNSFLTKATIILFILFQSNISLSQKGLRVILEPLCNMRFSNKSIDFIKVMNRNALEFDAMVANKSMYSIINQPSYFELTNTSIGKKMKILIGEEDIKSFFPEVGINSVEDIQKQFDLKNSDIQTLQILEILEQLNQKRDYCRLIHKNDKSKYISEFKKQIELLKKEINCYKEVNKLSNSFFAFISKESLAVKRININLKILGYDVDINRAHFDANTKKIIKDFFKDFKVTGNNESAIEADLIINKKINKYAYDLKTIGINNEINGNISESVKNLQQYYKKELTGTLDRSTLELIENDLSNIESFQAIKEVSPYCLFADFNKKYSIDIPIYSYYRDWEVSLYLVNNCYDINNTFKELYAISKGDVIARFRDIEAFEFIKNYFEKQIKSGDSKLSYFAPYKAEEPTVCFISGNREIEIPVSEIEALEKGIISDNLKNIFNTKDVIFFRDIFFQGKFEENNYESLIIKSRYFDNVYQINPTRLINILNNSELANRHNFYLGSDYTSCITNLSKLPQKVNSSQSIELLLKDPNTKVIDYGLSNNLKNIKGFSIYNQDVNNSSLADIEIAFGHKEIELYNYLTLLGVKKILTDKLLVLFSCYNKSDENFISKIINENNLRGVMYFTCEINSVAVNEVINEMSEFVLSHPEMGINIEQLFNHAVENCLNKNLKAYIKSEILKLKKNRLIQLSENIKCNYNILKG